MDVITLIRIVLGGRCPGVICLGDQLSLEEIVQVQLPGAIFLVGSCTGAKSSRGNFPGGNCPKWHLSGGQLSRGQLSRGELSCSRRLQPYQANSFYKNVFLSILRK